MVTRSVAPSVEPTPSSIARSVAGRAPPLGAAYAAATPPADGRTPPVVAFAVRAPSVAVAGHTRLVVAAATAAAAAAGAQGAHALTPPVECPMECPMTTFWMA